MNTLLKHFKFWFGPEPLRVLLACGLVGSMILFAFFFMCSALWGLTSLVAYAFFVGIPTFAILIILFDSKKASVHHSRWLMELESRFHHRDYKDPYPNFGELPSFLEDLLGKSSTPKSKNPLTENELESK